MWLHCIWYNFEVVDPLKQYFGSYGPSINPKITYKWDTHIQNRKHPSVNTPESIDPCVWNRIHHLQVMDPAKDISSFFSDCYVDMDVRRRMWPNPYQ